MTETQRNAVEDLQLVVDTMAAPVTRCSRDLRYLWVSNAYAAWLRRPIEEIVGRPIMDVIGAEGPPSSPISTGYSLRGRRP